MTPVIVVTHGNLARELVLTAQGILGQAPDLISMCLEPQEGIEDLQHKLSALLHDLPGALVLVDMFGGTPSNVAMMLSRQYPVEVITGANLPMVLEAVLHRHLLALHPLADLVSEKGRQSIMNANALLAANGKKGGDDKSCPSS